MLHRQVNHTDKATKGLQCRDVEQVEKLWARWSLAVFPSHCSCATMYKAACNWNRDTHTDKGHHKGTCRDVANFQHGTGV